jgi:hypothetical protein
MMFLAFLVLLRRVRLGSPGGRSVSRFAEVTAYVLPRRPKRDRVTNEKTLREKVLFQFSRFYVWATLERLREGSQSPCRVDYFEFTGSGELANATRCGHAEAAVATGF